MLSTDLWTGLSISHHVAYDLESTLNIRHQNFRLSILVHCLNKYDTKVGVQLRSPKKLYFIDNALAEQIGFNLSKNQGLWLENTVAIELQRRGKEFFYHSNGHECDFIVREGSTITQAIQVSVNIDDKATRKREVAGVLSAMKAHHLAQGIILTLNTRTAFDLEENCHIEVIPCWQWMLEYQ